MAGKRFHAGERREAFWRGHVSRWASSGATVSGYCRAAGLSAASFYYWRRVLQRRDGQAASRTVERPLEQPVFAELHLLPAQEALIEIALGGARRVRVHPGFDAATLSRVVAVLEEGAC